MIHISYVSTHWHAASSAHHVSNAALHEPQCHRSTLLTYMCSAIGSLYAACTCQIPCPKHCECHKLQAYLTHHHAPLCNDWLASATQLCAPREVVLQQLWREEEDGTFIVLLHSTKHRKASLPPASWSWWQPIRAEVPLPLLLHCLFLCPVALVILQASCGTHSLHLP